jgi:hypothetical protein
MNIQFITSISYGTLLTCCRQSIPFHNITNKYVDLDKVVATWKSYLFSNAENINKPESWVDEWNAFIDYSLSEALSQAEDKLLNEYNGQLISECEDSDTEKAYKLFFTDLGKLRLYKSGLITQGTKNIGFASTFSFNTNYLITPPKKQ